MLRESTPVEQPPARDPAVVRRRIRRVLAGVLVPLLVIGAAVGGYVAWALNAPLPEPVRAAVWEPETPTTDAATISMPTTGAAAIAVSGGDEARPIASITKLVTAMVVLDAHPIGAGEDGPTMSFGNADVAIYEDYYVRGAALAPVSRGATMSLRDVLRTVLIPSASNYATSMARWAFGSDAAFVRAADSWLEEHGLAHTRIVDATGLDPRNTSTPGDLLELARLAIATR